MFSSIAKAEDRAAAALLTQSGPAPVASLITVLNSTNSHSMPHILPDEHRRQAMGHACDPNVRMPDQLQTAPRLAALSRE
jgi:hypothetical protein